MEFIKKIITIFLVFFACNIVGIGLAFYTSHFIFCIVMSYVAFFSYIFVFSKSVREENRLAKEIIYQKDPMLDPARQTEKLNFSKKIKYKIDNLNGLSTSTIIKKYFIYGFLFSILLVALSIFGGILSTLFIIFPNSSVFLFIVGCILIISLFYYVAFSSPKNQLKRIVAQEVAAAKRKPMEDRIRRDEEIKQMLHEKLKN